MTYNVFWSYSPSFQPFSYLPSLPNPPNFVLSCFLKYPSNPVCVAHIWICGLPLAYDQLSRSYTTKENRLPFPKQLSVGNSSLSSGGTLCPSFLSILEFWVAWPLHKACVCCHNRFEFICEAAVLYSEDTISLYSSAISGSHTLPSPSSTMIPEPWEEGYRCPTKGWSFWSLLFFAPWPIVGLCVDHHLLQIEASLMRGERCVNLWVQC